MQRSAGIRIAAGLLWLVALAAPAFAAPTPLEAVESAQAAGKTLVVEPRVQREPTSAGLAHPGKTRAAVARTFRLDPPAPQALAKVGVPSKMGVPLRIGFGRDVPGLEDDAATAAALDWQRLADGASVAQVRVTSPTAVAVRAALRVTRLPDDAIVRFQAPGEDQVFEVSGEEIAATIARNLEAGADATEARLYWSPVIDGETAVVEIELPAGDTPREVRLSIPSLGHLVTSAATGFRLPTKSSSCELDAMCSSGWPNEMNAVAKMIFTDSGSSYACTGTLLADQDPASNVPYFLTANHCINTQASASSLATFWFYRSTSCNSGVVNSYRQLTGGATLLYNTSNTDTSFMRLNATPPQGAYYAGWTVGSTPALGSSATGLHHPGGDLLKYANGMLADYMTCTAPVNGSFSCNSALAPSATFYDVGWTSGLTEPGSSGSGLFLNGGYLIGQLYGGASQCTGGNDAYGRFDVAYNAGLKQWLSSQTLTVSRTGTGSGTVTSAPAGVNCGATCSASFGTGTSVTLSAAPATGSIFAGWSGACSGTGACVVAMNAPVSVSASFVPATTTLTVTTSGAGTVTSAPSGVNCGATCTAAFNVGSAVTLSASPASGMALYGWGGACSGTGSCSVNLNAPTAVSATFGPLSADVALAQTVAPSPASVGSDIVFTLNVTNKGPMTASNVTVVDTLPAGSTFVWASNGCAAAAGKVTCSVTTLAAAVTVPMTIVVRTASTGTLSNSAAVTATEPDPVSANNASTLAVMVNATPASNLANLSTRAEVLTGGDVLIGGFVIGGTTSKTVVVRARGPSLVPFGITNALANPVLQLVRSSDQSVVATNDDWGSAPNAAQVSASGFAPSDPQESAILATLPPGAYTAIVQGAGGATGVGMVEVFEVDHPESPLVNISTRSQVLSGGDVMIGGFVIQGTGPRTVLVRARGPSLVPYGITNAISNPGVRLVRSSDQATIAANDDWGTAANAGEIAASGYAPSSSLESAILITLDPGAYTAIVSGIGGATGVGIVEVFGL